jgi:murein L,D-transpeptidase YafK
LEPDARRIALPSRPLPVGRRDAAPRRFAIELDFAFSWLTISAVFRTVVSLFILCMLKPQASAVEIPSSSRSKAAEARVTAKLKEDLAKSGLALGSPVFVRIFKEPSVLEVWIKKGAAYERFRKYDICKFSGSLGPKLKEGDGQAPEGIYPVAPEQMNPNSRFHLAFNLGYPNAFDKFHGRTGSALMVHGNCVSVGCYAMGDDAIEEIWTLCAGAFRAGQTSIRFHIFPFPLTDPKLKREAKNPWIEFWKELKPIFDQFEATRIPPAVFVQDGHYRLK